MSRLSTWIKFIFCLGLLLAEEAARVLMFGHSSLLREVSSTLAEEGRLFTVILLGVRGHAVVAHCVLPTLAALVDFVLIAGVLQ